MKNIILTALTIACGFSAGSAAAQDASAFMSSPAFKGSRPMQCTTTLEMQRCAADDLRTADRKMSARYATLRTGLGSSARQRLLVEQRAWLRSRDRDCLARGAGGGTIASLNVARCWVDETKARAAALGRRSTIGVADRGVTRPSAFVGRWRGGEGTYMKITPRGGGFTIENQWGLDADMHGVFDGRLAGGGLTFRRRGVMETIRPGGGDRTDRSAITGKTDCLIVGHHEGYCRY